MIPIFLLGSSIYLGLQLTQLKLSSEKYMEEAQERVRQLEAEVTTLQERRLEEQSLRSGLPTPQPVAKSSHWWRWH